MCEYCNNDPKPILNTTYDIEGANCDIQNVRPTVGTLIMLDNKTKAAEIDFGINTNTFMKEKMYIKYCPMCGREL